VLSPGQAVAWAAFFNVSAGLLFGTAVAKTVGSGMVDLSVVTFSVIFAGLTGAILWDLFTWYYGLPTSSSHALFGGYAGAAIVKAGFDAIIVAGWTKVLVFMVLAPLIGLVVGLLLMTANYWIFRNQAPRAVDGWFRRLQLASAAAYSLMHGANDAQKTMGIIAALLYASVWKTQQAAFESGKIEFPFWIVLICHAAIALGTMAGGWRIVKTMGMKLTKLAPVGGFCAETAGALTLFGATLTGIPVSTTHTITGAIVGVGSTRRLSAVKWGVAGRILWAWILTMPMSALVAALCYLVLRAAGRG
jgi:PiT family inorganic phosphate transporter